MTLCLVLLLRMHVVSLAFSPGVLRGRAAEAGRVDVQDALTFLGEKHLGSSGLDAQGLTLRPLFLLDCNSRWRGNL